ncbi:MAG: NAD-dependent epimerase/dehydratase family protein [Armatimonadota bacterium]|nr:NAD-dependent epimerase/dehydratase family protein [Armatimonadota bacterium]MDR7451996.1 NAD-dependent epimerase/dehydratase family protein [Armatimonadota bacterium]MDR7467887.1 NAD-dependent epimerase/dehydratase family protein [Armatimonadota bacterium]MDR7494260.1 NAD-dependent epimerase/dehydratase family protein [Armatimonadota bacterium]MDR7500041.1 NAD-dependent epimerase/dehydratase family protein [Armatimonadota bacterium]
MRRLNRGTVLRLLADTLLVNTALVLAYTLRLVIYVLAVNPPGVRWLITEEARHLAFLSPVLTLLALAIFALSGFYTYGRVYRGRYKAVVVAQAVTLIYILLALLSYLRVVPAVPRGIWIGGWLLTLLFVGGARVLAVAWAEVSHREARLLRLREDASVRRVLVIGGAGYVGSALVRQLLDRGYGVRVLDMLLYGDQAMRELRAHPNFEFLQGDFRNVEAVVRAMQDVDAVAHLGAIVGDPAGDLEPQVTLEVNVAATRLIAEVARGVGVRRFVFTSTCSVYGASDGLLDERSPVNAISLYAKSKLDSEAILLGMTDGQFSPVILRLGTLYGLSYRPRFDLVVNLLAAQAVLEHRITIVDGDQWRPFVHVEDAARAILRCLEVPATLIAGQVFNVGATAENYQIKDLGAMIMALVPGTEVRTRESGGERRNYRVSCDKIARTLGYRPLRTVRDGIAEIKGAIERGEIQDYTASEYSNYKFLSQARAALVRTEGAPPAQVGP